MMYGKNIINYKAYDRSISVSRRPKFGYLGYLDIRSRNALDLYK